MEASSKKARNLWSKLRSAVQAKVIEKETLQQNFFDKKEVEEEGRTYIVYSLSTPLLKIRKLKSTLNKEQLIKACKNSIDSTGNISSLS